MPLDANQERLLVEIANEVKNNEGILSQKLLDQLYQTNYLTNPDFNTFIDMHLIPNLSEKELFNLTLSFLQAHIEKKGDRKLLTRQNDNDITTLLYDAFRERMEYQSHKEPYPSNNPMNALHWYIYQSHVKNTQGLPMITAADALKGKYLAEHSKTFSQAVVTNANMPRSDDYIFKTRGSSVDDRMLTALNPIKISGDRAVNITQLQIVSAQLGKELSEKGVSNKTLKEMKQNFIDALIAQLSNPINNNKTIPDVIKDILNKNSEYEFKKIIAGFAHHKVKDVLEKVCGKNQFKQLALELKEKPAGPRPLSP